METTRVVTMKAFLMQFSLFSHSRNFPFPVARAKKQQQSIEPFSRRMEMEKKETLFFCRFLMIFKGRGSCWQKAKSLAVTKSNLSTA